MKNTHFLEVFNGVCNKDRRSENEFFKILMESAESTFRKFNKKYTGIHWNDVEDAVMVKINWFFSFDFSTQLNPTGFVSLSFKNLFIDVTRAKSRRKEDNFTSLTSDDFTEETLVEELSTHFYEINDIGEEFKNTSLDILSVGIRNLPPKQKKVLTLLSKKYTCEQVAMLLDCSLQCVYNNKQLGKENLKKWKKSLINKGLLD